MEITRHTAVSIKTPHLILALTELWIAFLRRAGTDFVPYFLWSLHKAITSQPIQRGGMITEIHYSFSIHTACECCTEIEICGKLETAA